MLRHIVIFKYCSGTGKDDPRVADVYARLARLPAQIPEHGSGPAAQTHERGDAPSPREHKRFPEQRCQWERRCAATGPHSPHGNGKFLTLA